LADASEEFVVLPTPSTDVRGEVSAVSIGHTEGAEIPDPRGFGRGIAE
jgi:hypothetical protein